MALTAEPPSEGHKRGEMRLRHFGLVAATLVAVGALVAACGGGSDPASSSGSNPSSGASTNSSAKQSGIAFAACMRANGVPNFPDSAVSVSDGRVELQAPAGVDTNSSQFQSAEQTCRKDLPNGANSGSGSSSGSSAQQVINFANCMRSHGVPNFPEPNSQGQELITGQGINPNSPQFESAMATCQHLLPAGAVAG